MGKNLLCRTIAAFGILCVLSACSHPQPQAAVEPMPDTQMISVNTPGVSGAHCFLQVSGMSYPVAAPGKVMVRRSTVPMDVTCFKGEHMVGNGKVVPACKNCGYPNTVTIAMALDTSSMKRDVQLFNRAVQ